MRQIIAAGILVLLSVFHVQAAESITGEYRTVQTNLTGTLKVKQLPGNQVKFEIQTVKKGGGDYAGHVTTCTAEGVAELRKGGQAIYQKNEDYMEKPFNLNMAIRKSSIKVDSNAEEVRMCGMGAWIDGTYRKNNNKEPRFSE